MISILKKSIPYLLALVLIFVLWKFIDFQMLIEQFKKANLFFVVVSMLIMAFSHYLRALRMNMLLKALGNKTSDLNTSLAVFVGYLVNLLIPRMGEVARCTVLNKTNSIPIQVSLGAVITERIVDVLCLISFLIFSLFIEYDVVISFIKTIISSKNGTINTTILFFIIFLLITLIIIIYLIIKNIDKILKINIFKKIYDVIIGFSTGMMSIFKVENKVFFFICSLGTWICYFLLTWVLMMAFEPTMNLGWKVGFITNALGAVGMAAPVQGGIGAYHFMVQQVLVVYGITPELGLVCATLLHSTQMFTSIILGIIAFIILFFITKINNKII